MSEHATILIDESDCRFCGNVTKLACVGWSPPICATCAALIADAFRPRGTVTVVSVSGGEMLTVNSGDVVQFDVRARTATAKEHSEIVHKLAAATRLATAMVQNGHRFDSETASWACGDCSEPFNDAFGKPRKHAHDCDAAHILGLEREGER